MPTPVEGTLLARFETWKTMNGRIVWIGRAVLR